MEEEEHWSRKEYVAGLGSLSLAVLHADAGS